MSTVRAFLTPRPTASLPARSWRRAWFGTVLIQASSRLRGQSPKSRTRKLRALTPSLSGLRLRGRRDEAIKRVCCRDDTVFAQAAADLPALHGAAPAPDRRGRVLRLRRRRDAPRGGEARVVQHPALRAAGRRRPKIAVDFRRRRTGDKTA